MMLEEDIPVDSSIVDSSFGRPLKVESFNKMDPNEVLTLFLKLKESPNLCETTLIPPVLPKAGSFYLYYLGTDCSAYESKKKKLRCNFILIGVIIIIILLLI